MSSTSVIKDFGEFAPVRMIASNSQVESWLVKRTSSGKRTLVKIAAPDSPFDRHRLQQTLIRSFEVQRALRSPLVNRATALYRSGESVAVEYPWLAGSVWSALGDDFSPLPIVACLAEIALMLDFLHLCGVVHGDFKPANVMCAHHSNGFDLRLVDLDFLTPAGQSPRANLFGTPGHIAPEIVANQAILPQSDAYSLGMALRHSLDSAGQDLTQAEGLTELCKELTQADYLNRPGDLLMALARHGIIDTPTHEKLSRRLFQQFVISQYRSLGRKRPRTTDEFESFFRKRCRIIGLSRNFLLAAGAALEKNSRAARRAVADFFSSSMITRSGIHYLVQADDRGLLSAYSEFLRITAPDIPESERRSSYHRMNWPEAELLSSLNEVGCADVTDGDADRLIDLGARAYELNRLTQANELFSRALQTAKPCHHRVHLDIAVLSRLNLGLWNSAEDLAREGISAAQQAGDRRLELILKRMLSWLYMLKGMRDESCSLLEEVRRESRAESFRDIEALAEYTTGVIHWRMGEDDQAMASLEKSVALADRVTTPGLVSALSTLSLVKFDVSDYAGAAQAARTAINLAPTVGQGTLIAPTCIVLVMACVRLADFNKADYWLRRFYGEIMTLSDPQQLLHYLYLSGFVALWRGEISRAEEACGQAQEIALHQATPGQVLGKVYTVLAECALVRGNDARLEANIRLARDIICAPEDVVSRAELDMICHIAQLTDQESVDLNAVYSTIDTLVDHRRYFYAALGIFHLLAEGEQIGTEIRDRRDRMAHVIANHDVPVFRVLSSLLYPSDTPGTAGTLSAWKQAFIELRRGGDLFRAMIAARRLSSLYLEHGRIRPARKYIQQTKKIAEGVQNTAILERIAPAVTRLVGDSDGQTHLVESFHAISEVLKEVHDYSAVLHRLVQCAVEQTGAERGVILLACGNAARLHPVASYNCDDDSLSDIVDISRSIPESAASDSLAVLIDNATKDSRTRSLKSVIAHNILSVAAVPLRVDGQVIGVLYLDHHTIPALFEPGDKRYIDAIANFVAVALGNAQSYRFLQAKSEQLEKRLEHLGEAGAFITRDPTIGEIFEQLDRISLTTAPVLLLGASGTGKEIIAERIHALSPRARKALVKLNCASLSPTLIESELFGIVKNVATGVSEREGRLAVADGSTLFLDEIGDMPIEVQAKLLRVVEYQEYEKVGSNRVIHSDIRFICATNKDIRQIITEGKFREDLFYRINTVTVEIPPLHRRSGDIPLLLDHFVHLLAQGEPPILTPETVGLLSTYIWPGNVRELKNLVERLCILLPGKAVTPAHLPEQIRAGTPEPNIPALAENIEAARIRDAWKTYTRNQSKVSSALGIPLSTLRRKLKKLDLL